MNCKASCIFDLLMLFGIHRHHPVLIEEDRIASSTTAISSLSLSLVASQVDRSVRV